VACTGTLTVSQASVTNAEVRTGGYQTTAKLVLDYTTVTNATIIGQYPRSEPIEVNNSTVSGSVINSDSCNLGIKLTGTAVSGSQLQMGCCGANLTLVGGTVGSSSMTEGFGSPVNGPLTINGTTLTNTPVTLPSATAAITGATFTYTSGATSPKLQFKSGTVTNTTVTGNGSGVGLEFASGYGDVTVSGTTITDFATGLRFSGVRNSGALVVGPGNQFARNSSYNLDNRTAIAVAATYNFWGTADAGQVGLKIFDQVDDITSGLVSFGSYLTSAPIYPAISSNPASQTVTAFGPVTFSASAIGNPAPVFQWKKNGVSILGATSATYTINSAVVNDAGAYTAVVSSVLGTATSTVATLTVNRATATLVLGSLSATYNGSPHSASATTTPSSLSAGYTYNGSATAPIDAGTYAVVGTISDPNYQGSTSGTLTIAKAIPTITWATPIPIFFGTALSGAQLNAAANTAGTFVYNPTVGEIRAAGLHALSVSFTPTDSVNYSGASAQQSLVVNQPSGAPLFVTQPTSQAVAVGSSHTLTAFAIGAPAPAYQWQKNGVNIVGATGSSYTIASVGSGDAANYTVVVTNFAGTATSNPATLETYIATPTEAVITITVE